MDLKLTRYEGVGWIQQVQNTVQWRAVVNTVMNFRVTQKAGNFLSSGDTIRFSSRTVFHGLSWECY
jgi:hypothetical protein